MSLNTVIAGGHGGGGAIAVMLCSEEISGEPPLETEQTSDLIQQQSCYVLIFSTVQIRSKLHLTGDCPGNL